MIFRQTQEESIIITVYGVRVQIEYKTSLINWQIRVLNVAKLKYN